MMNTAATSMELPYDVVKMTRSELRFLTKPIATYNNVLMDHNELTRHVKLSQLSFTHGKSDGVQMLRLGKLTDLPLELIWKLFSELTVHSLFRLRATCSGFETLIRMWEPYRRALSDAQPVLAGLIATGASHMWSFIDVNKAIYTTECSLCGQHGEVIHLLKMRRVCLNCVTTDRRLLAVDERYAEWTMGLTRAELDQLPRLRTIAQRSLFGRSFVPYTAVDYTAAVDLAMKGLYDRGRVKFPDVQSELPMEFVPAEDSEPLESKRYATTRPVARTLLHVRRPKSWNLINPQKYPLPDFLINPPESLYTQHACCVHLPGLETPPDRPLTRPTPKVKAYLCAGCSFYFNYHSSLPHQTHAVYRHSEIPPSSSPTWVPFSVWMTPLREHLRDCPFARLYWDNLNPQHLVPYPANPLLDTNGGPRTAQDLNEQLRTHQIALLGAESTSNFLHFQRHMYCNGHVDMATNNTFFELVPTQHLEFRHEVRIFSHTTLLDHELRLRSTMNDAVIAPMIDPDMDDADDLVNTDTHSRYLNYDPVYKSFKNKKFDAWTRDRLEQLHKTDERRMRRADLLYVSDNVIKDVHAVGMEQDVRDEEDVHIFDMVLDGLAGTTAGGFVSQATWATTRPASANCLFRGWLSLLDERREHQMTWLRKQGIEPGQEYTYGPNGWGFDRFGCVSHWE